MGKFLAGFVLPSLLLSAALINWSLISLVDLIAFLLILYNVSQIGFQIRRSFLLLWPIVIFSVVAILSQVTYLVIWAVKPMSWSIPDASWAKLIGFMIVQSWKSPYVIYFLVIQLLALLVALVDIYGKSHFLKTWQDPSWGHFLSLIEHLGSHLRVASCLLLPAIQLVVGISHPSWASLPFFIVIFFLVYLLSHNVSRKMRQALILLCEIHFSLLYVLQINLISTALEKKGSLSMEIVMQLGLRNEDSAWDFLEVALLACFCAIHNHGFEMLFSFSAIIQHAPSPPIGFGILKAGLNKSVLLSVYSSSSVRNSDESLSYERRIASYLSAIGQKFLSIYRSCGSHVAFVTILLTVYMVRPNYISFGYIFLLLLWIIGRQLVERTKRQLWLPLKVYAILVFIFIYSLSSFSSLEMWLSKLIDLYLYLGYDSKASSFDNVWESLAVLIVMQLYSYERRKNKQNRQDHLDQLEPGALGFIRRFIIWHSQKILFIALFYASLNSISAFGFLYLIGLIFCSILPKTSSIPSKSFLAYTGFLVTAEYLFQMWGLIVDDPRMLISYFVVFMLACFKLRADRLPSFSGSSTYRQIMSQRRNTFVWRDLSFETKSMWTFVDYLRLYCYCHLLDLVLILILITGTLEYDILHLGYLAFALIFFRMRLEILKKKNKIFKFLRIYNFAVIITSLAYQSPFIGGLSAGKCETVNDIYEMIGFYKYDYGFRITARSAIVEIIIFVLVSLQSYMFSSQEFDYVCRYLEAEQIGAIVREQEKKAAWKTAQLQQIRESEEKKQQRNMQVEKMKSEMLNLQIQLLGMNTSTNCIDGFSHSNEGLRRRRSVSLASNNDIGIPDKEDQVLGRLDHTIREDSVYPINLHEPSACTNVESPLTEDYMKHSVDSPFCEITEIDIDTSSSDSGKKEKFKGQAKENPLKSAVQLIGDGVSQVQFIGNQAVNNLVSFLNISQEDSDSNEHTNIEDRIYDEMESQKTRHIYMDRSSSVQSDKSSDAASLQLGRIFRYIWHQMRSNNDVVCYFCFVLVFLWNFSLLSMVYLGALFLYALCVNTGPSYIFWIIMLIYTELYILLQYLYQIVIQHCGLSIDPHLLRELGFPTHKITSSFVVSSLPLFLVYLFTLIQSSITPKDGEWMSSTDFKFKRNDLHAKDDHTSYNWQGRARDLLNQMIIMVKLIIISFFRYWKSLTQGAESPPYFVQVSMDVNFWPEDGIQPERIESGINQVLRIVHNDKCKAKNPNLCSFASRVNVQSIERSQEKPNVALVVFEVVYASPVIDCSSTEWNKSLTPASDVAKEILKAQRAGFVEEMGFPYRILSVIGGGKREIDLYAYIFCADLIVFFLVAIFYQSVIKNKSEFLEVYQLEDQFPKEYVFMLMAIFFLIVLDRILYLCSFATWKVVFYIFNLVLFTYSVTEYDWQLEPSQQHTAQFALRAIFLAKAVSLGLQAIQIQYGIPHKSTLYRQFLTSEVSRINYLGYRLYRALPFLYELRCVLDWSCTTTSLTMYDWLKMYSSGNPTNIANPIKDASFQVDIKTASGRLNLYQTTLCERLQWDLLNSNINPDPYGYLGAYNKNDIQLICCQADASTLWLVPLVVRTRLIQSLEWNIDMEIFSTWILSRDRPKGKEIVKYEKAVDPQYLPTRSDVQKVLNGSMNSFSIYNVYPRYFRVTGSGDVRPLEEDNAVSADLIINREQLEWWAFRDTNPSNLSRLCGGLTGPMAIIVSEETPPQGILGDTLSKFSIWGLYITFVLAVGRFIRLQCADLRMRIPYENLPSCDRLIAICEDIYAARAEGELGIEEVLYWTLVKIYRSPHMLLEYTKPD
ncbi:Piezo-type mechanosensitive ion channel component 2 [Glycine soja]|nr:Piezo-type mechanosensitive ion channel component 2 [Glycine soja]